MTNPVYFYIPNLIGYSRIIFAVMAFYFIDQYFLFYIFYSLSAILDIADGHAARAFNQCTKFGAILDMVTDRASTTCLIVVLAQFYPNYLYPFLFLVALDIISHFAHIYSSLIRGEVSHKKVNAKQSWLIRMYYTNRLVLGSLCFGNEGFFIMLYMLHFWSGPLLYVGPVASYIGGSSGSAELVKVVLWLLFFPVMAVKQFINGVQLLQAFKDIAEIDINEKKR